MKSRIIKTNDQITSQPKSTGFMHTNVAKILIASTAILLLSFCTHDNTYIKYALTGRSNNITLNESETIKKQTIISTETIGTPTKSDIEPVEQADLANTTNGSNPISTTKKQATTETTTNHYTIATKSETTKTNPSIKNSSLFKYGMLFHEKYQKSVEFAPEVGINMNGMYNNSSSNTMVNGYHLGGMFNINLSKHISIQPGIIYINKGAVSFKTTSTYNSDQQIRQSDILHYAQIPVNLVFKTGQPTDGRFIVGFGPYVAYLFNIEQKNTDNNTNTGDGYVPGYLLKDQISIPEPVLTRIDIGLNSFIGCEMPNGIYCKAGAEIGFINLQANSNANFGFSLSTGVFIR